MNYAQYMMYSVKYTCIYTQCMYELCTVHDVQCEVYVSKSTLGFMLITWSLACTDNIFIIIYLWQWGVLVLHVVREGFGSI